MTRTTTGPKTGETAPDPRAFGVAIAAVFAVAALALLAQHASMAAMGGEPMSGGWMASAAWLRPCGQGAGRAFAAFAGMWGAMTVTMMLPVLAPQLWHYRLRIGPRPARSAWLVVVAGAGYFAVWIALGALVFPAGAALTTAAARLPALARAMPFAAGVVVLAAGALQFSGWKARRLACCRHAAAHGGHVPRAAAVTAWRYGVHAAIRCGACCGNLMAVALAAGMMDLRVMAAVTVAIAAERVAPAGGRVARIVGCGAVAGGIAMIVRAVGLT
jgi:predicted metal-binding membrane protein